MLVTLLQVMFLHVSHILYQSLALGQGARGIQGSQIQCRKDQMQVSHVDKNIVEQSSTVP